MTVFSAFRERRRSLRGTLLVLLVIFLALAAYVAWPGRTGNKIVGYFPSAVGL